MGINLTQGLDNELIHLFIIHKKKNIYLFQFESGMGPKKKWRGFLAIYKIYVIQYTNKCRQFKLH